MPIRYSNNFLSTHGLSRKVPLVLMSFDVLSTSFEKLLTLLNEKERKTERKKERKKERKNGKSQS